MNVNITIDTGPLLNLLNRLPFETKAKVTRLAVAAGARVIRDKAKELAPYDPKRRTGTHLRDAIIVRKLKGTNDIMRVGVDARKGPHGHLQEYGTIAHSANPFLRPAADQTKQEVAAKVTRMLALGIFREARRLGGG